MLSLLIECGVTSGVWCYQWSGVLQVEAVVSLVESGAIPMEHDQSPVLPVGRGATGGVLVWCYQWSVVLP